MMTKIEKVEMHRADKGHGKRFVFMAVAFLTTAVFMTWAWNNVAAGLLSAPQADFKHGLALASAVAAGAVLVRTIWL